MISIQFQYRPLFEVSFGHEFFDNKILKGFNIVPEGDTMFYINDFGMLFKKTDLGFKILIDNLNPEALSLKLERVRTENIKLRFLLYITDPFFKSYSDVSFDTSSKIYLLSNKGLADKNNGLLHKNDFLCKENLFTLGQETLENNSDVNVPIVNKGVPVALIELELNEIIISKVLDRLLYNEIETFSYNVHIASRSVKWRYIIKAEAAKKAEGLSVNTEEGDVKFSKGEKVKYKDSEVVIFEANSDIKFQERYTNNVFQLKRKNGISGSKVLRRRLPNASFESLIPDLENNGKYYSDILVYI